MNAPKPLPILAWRAALVAFVLALVAAGLPAVAQPGGTVQVPLDEWQALVAAAESGAEGPNHAVQSANLDVRIVNGPSGPTGTVTARVSVRILQSERTLVPLLPAGTAVTTARQGGAPIALVATPAGLAWVTETAGTFALELTYPLDVRTHDGGRVVHVPTPTAGSTSLRAEVPASDVPVTVVPGSGVTTTSGGSGTVVTATLPPTQAVQLAWGDVSGASGAWTLSRATYTGDVGDDAVTWTAEYVVDLDSDGRVTVDLLDRDLALLDLTVDGDAAPIRVRGDAFAVAIERRGRHTVVARFQAPISRASGAPRVSLPVPRVPVSRFVVNLPGEKDLEVTPAASVVTELVDGDTVATVNVAMTDQVAFSWTEAVPDDAAAEIEVRQNASIYHSAHAEEGVLYVQGMVVFEVTRGETSRFVLAAPPEAQINRITSTSGAVADWRRSDEDDTVTVFLDRQVSGEFRLDVEYERLIGSVDAGEREVGVPLLTAVDVHRQRGMVALLSSDELTLQPVGNEGLTPVGENQLPAWVRDRITMTVAHTFRYFDAAPSLAARVAEPERQDGRFDAEVDTLVSIDDVTTEVSASVELNVKQGSVMALELRLPADVNVLRVAAPSLRDHEVTTDGDEQVIAIAFTREMEGQLRVDVGYERINADDTGTLPVPLVHVTGAEVEQGRIAVEALTAVEVQPASVEHLQTMDLSELPRQLIGRTTNPILLAYKYVQADPPPSMELEVTRHREIAVRDATIDDAHYRTLYTPDGFAVTTARFTVRNSRQQFLRVTLPEGSEVWSASVGGTPESPALDDGDSGPEVLVPIIHSVEGFEVELIYSTPAPAIGWIGSIRGELPRPDMIVTSTTWDVYLPDDVTWGEPGGELDLVEWGMIDDEVADDFGALADGSLRLTVPNRGRRYTFEKLYANQLEGAVGFTIPYTATEGVRAREALGVGGAALFWVGLVLGWRRRDGLRIAGFAGAILGAGMVGFAVLGLGADPAIVVTPSIVVVLVAGVAVAWRPVATWLQDRLEASRARRAEAAAAPTPTPTATPTPVDVPSTPAAAPSTPDLEPVDDRALQAVLDDLRLADDTSADAGSDAGADGAADLPDGDDGDEDEDPDRR